MKKLNHFIMLLSIIILTYSCSNNNDDDMPDPTPPNTDVTYSSNVKSIIDGNCNSCHGNPTTNGAPMMLTNYTQVKEAVENRSLVTRIENGTMPPNGNLTSTQIQTIKNWQSQGFKQ